MGSYSTFSYHRAKESGGIKSLLSLPSCGLVAIGDRMLTPSLMLVSFYYLYQREVLGVLYINLYLRTLLSHK